MAGIVKKILNLWNFINEIYLCNVCSLAKMRPYSEPWARAKTEANFYLNVKRKIYFRKTTIPKK